VSITIPQMPALIKQETAWDPASLRDPHHQADKAARVQAMFDAIAPTYERVNRWMSAGRDRYWRRTAVKLARITSHDRVLDLACGTGDFARAFASANPASVVGMDYSENMLRLAAARPERAIQWCRGDALKLPVGDASFDVVSCAFGVRNFQDLPRGLGEMHRVLRPEGRIVILEFSMPRSNLAGRAYLAYFRHVMPRIATWISRDQSGAYRYLPKSVSSFIGPAGMQRALEDAGFDQVSHHSLTIGVVSIYLARKRS
jgi:demethylmenaquinone methyltransferase/2-methoxy-6-polyprenyl-1,4-benzoquinol methylase